MKTDMIELIPVGQAVGPLKWEMSLNGGKSQPHDSYPVLSADHETDHDFSFTIRHPGAIKFAQTDPFCAQIGSAKPTACDAKAFTWDIDAKSGALVVHDHNPVPGTYTYVINFNGAPQLDPIIKNGGCCTGTSSATYSATTIAEYGALLLLVVAAVIAARQIFFRRDNDTIKPS